MEEHGKQGYGMAFLKVVDKDKWDEYAPKAGMLAKQFGVFAKTGGNLSDCALYVENEDGYYDMAVLMEYPTFEDHAKKFYISPEYQSNLLPLRLEAAKGPFVLTEGVKRPADKTGILIAAVKVANKNEMAKYNPGPSIQAYGGMLLFKTASPAVSDGVEGDFDFCVAVAFPTAKKAEDWMKSDEYKEMKEIRLAYSVGPLAILDAAN